MDKIFISVLNMSFTASYVILVICIVRLLIKKAPKLISYALWSVVGIRLVCPCFLQSDFSLLPFNAAPISQDIAYQTELQFSSGISVLNRVSSDILPAAQAGTGVSLVQADPLQSAVEAGICIWLAGIAVMLAYSFVSMLILKKRLADAKLVEENIYEVGNLKTPFILGIFKPKIYLPAGLAQEEKSLVVMHEKIHMRRFDHVVKPLAFLILSIHWFNPLAWAAYLLMGMDMEQACDESMLMELGSEIKKTYSYSIFIPCVGTAHGKRHYR